MDSLVTGTLQYETGKPHVKLDFEEGRGRENTYYIKIDLNQNFILALLVLSSTCLNISPVQYSPSASLIQMINSGGSSLGQNKLPQLILGCIYILKHLQSNFIGKILFFGNS